MTFTYSQKTTALPQEQGGCIYSNSYGSLLWESKAKWVQIHFLNFTSFTYRDTSTSITSLSSLTVSQEGDCGTMVASKRILAKRGEKCSWGCRRKWKGLHYYVGLQISDRWKIATLHCLQEEKSHETTWYMLLKCLILGGWRWQVFVSGPSKCLYLQPLI